MRVLEKRLASKFSEKSFAYQKNKGIVEELELIKKYIQEGAIYVAKLDIQDFFDNISRDKMLLILEKQKVDKITMKLIEKFLKCEIEYNNINSQKIKEIIQGSPLSPILSNIYLNNFDKLLEGKNYKFARFSDDIFLFETTKKELEEKMDFMIEVLKKDYELEINKNKIIIDNAEKIDYLGYKILKNDGQIEFIKKSRTQEKVCNYWKASSIRYENNEYHIVNDGILNKKDFSLLFENKEKKRYIPVEVTNSINIYSEVIIANNFFDYINDKNITINFFNKYGKYIGKFLPNKSRKSALTVLKQIEIYNDSKRRMNLAKDIIIVGIHNILSNIKYYNRRYELNLDEKINKIIELRDEMRTSEEYNKILLLEARIREIYYSTFNLILKNKDYYFYKRTKRPPEDPINSLISFGNALLYNYIAKEIYKTTLDIRIAFLHASNNRYESLNLDISEVFKPIIVDRVIFSLINKKMINAKVHFEKNNQAVYLNKEGKTIFIREFYEKLKEALKSKNGAITYEMLIRKEIYKLLNYINGETKDYKAFKYY